MLSIIPRTDISAFISDLQFSVVRMECEVTKTCTEILIDCAVSPLSANHARRFFIKRTNFVFFWVLQIELESKFMS
jgi:hypothetical protein